MPKHLAGPEVERLVQLLGRLPGLGPRSARKATLALLRRRADLLAPLAAAMTDAAARVVACRTCGNIDTRDPCGVCTDDTRDPTLIVVVADIGDLWALERAGVVSGRYHVLGGVLSPLDGVGPDRLSIDPLMARVSTGAVTEVLLALNATVEGQSTAHYLSERLADVAGLTVSRLAHGVPIGGELDYLDEGTLAAAIKSRRRL
jgi:recombination protein RecR